MVLDSYSLRISNPIEGKFTDQHNEQFIMLSKSIWQITEIPQTI